MLICKILAKHRHTRNYTPTTSTLIIHVDDLYPHLLRKITNMFTEVTSALFSSMERALQEHRLSVVSTWRDPS